MKCQRHDKISLALYEAVKHDYANGRKTSEIAAWHGIGESTANFIRRSDSYLGYQMAVANKRTGKMTKKQARDGLERLVKGRMARPELVRGAKVAPMGVSVVLTQKRRKWDAERLWDTITMAIELITAGITFGALILLIVILVSLFGRML